MPTCKQKGIIKSFRLRIKKKYNNIAEETENLSHLLQTCLSQFNSRVSELLEKDDNDFYKLYQKLTQDLENYRGNLFHVQTIIEKTLTEDATNEFCMSIQDVSDDSLVIIPEKDLPVQSISGETTDKSEKLKNLNANSIVSSNQISLLKDSAVVENQISDISGYRNQSIISVTRDTDVESSSHQISYDQEGSEKSFSHSSCYRSFSSNFSDIYTEETPSNFPEKDSKVTESCISKSEIEHFTNKCSQKLAAPIVQLPNVIVPSNFSATLTHIIDPGNFWLQLENFNDLDFPVSDYIQQQSLLNIEEGIFCLARFKSTSFYYRAKILTSRNLEGKVKVLFIDHGSTEDISPHDLRQIPWAAYDVPRQAINCFLLGVLPIGSNWSSESIQRFKEFQYYSIKTQVLYKVNDKFGVKLIANVSEDFNEDFSADIAQSLHLDNLAIQGSMGPCDPEMLNILDQPSSFEKQCDKYASYSENRIFVCNDNKISCDSGVSVTYTDKSGHVSQENNSSGISCDSVHHSILPLSASKETCDFQCSKANEFAQNNTQNEGNDLISFESVENIDSIDDTSNESKKSVSVEEFQTSETSCYSSDFSLNLHVPPPKLSFVEKNMMLVMSSHIVSPSEFYVNMAMENSSNLDDLREQMTSTYDALSQTFPPINEKDIVENMCCAVRFEEDGSWYRAKVLHFSLKDKRKEVVVQYVDWGNSVIMEIHNLYPLSRQFAKYPAFALKCCLAGCIPKKTRCDSNPGLKSDWDEEAISLFKELIRPERCFTAQLFKDQHEEHGETLHVWLWDTEGSKDLLINSALVAKGVANFDNTAIRELMLQEKFKKCNETDILNEWDPMSEEFHSIENSYGVPIEDLEIATIGYKPKDEDYTCKYFALRGSCPRGTDCPFLHVPLTESGITRDQEEVYSFDNVISLPEGARNVLLEVSSVITPGHFYGIFPFGTKDVNELDSLVLKGLSNEELINKEAQCLFYAMNKHYSEAAFDENTTVALPYGNIVAAKRKFDNKWHRGRIIDVHDIAGPVEVFFVDFGHKEWVPRKYIRKILTQYLHTPFQAVECSLADVVPKDFENGKPWSLEAINFFKECISEELLLAEIKYRCGHVLKVTLRKTSKYNHAFISELLVNKGYALFESTSQSQMKESLYVPG